jgi:hypothetical protein
MTAVASERLELRSELHRRRVLDYYCPPTSGYWRGACGSGRERLDLPRGCEAPMRKAKHRIRAPAGKDQV